MTSTADYTNKLQKYYSKELLQHAIQLLVMNQFALESTLPAKQDSKQISWFRKSEASRTNVEVLTEGSGPSTKRKVTLTEITATLVQIGELAEVTDILSNTQMLNVLQMHIDTMGEDCALDADARIRDAVVPNLTGTSKRYAQGLANFAALAAAAEADACLKSSDGLGACTRLKLNRAPRIGNEYIGIISPEQSHDLRLDTRWVEASKYAASKQLLNGEVGTLDGVRYVENTNPFIEDDVEGTYDDDGGTNRILSAVFTGKGAWGCAKLGGESPYSPKVMISRGPDKSDALDQLTKVGWKAFWIARLLNNNFANVVRTKSTFA